MKYLVLVRATSRALAVSLTLIALLSSVLFATPVGAQDTSSDSNLESADAPAPLADDDESIRASQAANARVSLSNGAFVEQQFGDFFVRPIDAGTLRYWSSRLDSDLSQGELIEAFIRSEEYASIWFPVARLYLAAFGRLPDAGGWVFWAGLAREGRSISSISDGFVASPEGQARLGGQNNEARVRTVYRNVLGREGDRGGVAFWASRLNDGMPLSELIVAFSASPEFTDRTQADLDVARLFTAVLSRSGDAASLTHWAGVLREGSSVASVAEAFLTSEEYHRRLGLTMPVAPAAPAAPPAPGTPGPTAPLPAPAAPAAATPDLYPATACLAPPSGLVTSDSLGLSVRVTPAQTSVKRGEAVTATVVVTNRSDQTWTLDLGAGFDLTLGSTSAVGLTQSARPADTLYWPWIEPGKTMIVTGTIGTAACSGQTVNAGSYVTRGIIRVWPGREVDVWPGLGPNVEIGEDARWVSLPGSKITLS